MDIDINLTQLEKFTWLATVEEARTSFGEKIPHIHYFEAQS